MKKDKSTSPCPGYVKEALVRFKHKLRRKTDQPHRHEPPKYGATIQYAKEEDSSDSLDAKETQSIQQITGTFLYYARVVDPTMLVALSAIASTQAKPTMATLEKQCHSWIMQQLMKIL